MMAEVLLEGVLEGDPLVDEESLSTTVPLLVSLGAASSILAFGVIVAIDESEHRKTVDCTKGQQTQALNTESNGFLSGARVPLCVSHACAVEKVVSLSFRTHTPIVRTRVFEVIIFAHTRTSNHTLLDLATPIRTYTHVET